MLAGKYRVERVLGSGGMGMVVAARHLELGELRAIKYMVPTSHSPEESVARFMREARAAARLRSEHALKVHDVGRFDSGEPYMVMEYLEGRDLRQELKVRGALPVEQGVDWVLQACEALAEAHALGIIHRDLKPSNLFVTSAHGGEPIIKVLDFGISKLIGASADHDSDDLTQTAEVLGTPAYMSPEQMAEARDIDARTDVWSLGVILFELLTGVKPFAGRSIPAITMAVTAGPPPSVRRLRPDVAPDLERVILHSLSRDRTTRFFDVESLALALAPHGSLRSAAIIERIGRFARVSMPEGISSSPRMSAPTPMPPFGVGPPSSPTAASWGADALPLTSRRQRARVVATLGLMLALAGVALAIAFAFQETPNAAQGWTDLCDRIARDALATAEHIEVPAAEPEVQASATPQASPRRITGKPLAPKKTAAKPKEPKATKEPKEPEPAASSGPRDDPFGETWH